MKNRITLKAIETVYNGYRFRSRLEARWAVFFDTLGIEYQYEPQGFNLGSGIRYLPDFWLPQVKMWAEVKGQPLDNQETEKAQRLARLSKFPVLMLIGLPENKPYDAWEWREGETPDIWTIDYCLTMYHNYPVEEGRFYCMPGDYDHPDGDAYWNDTEEAATAARQARFEHGQVGAPSEWNQR